MSTRLAPAFLVALAASLALRGTVPEGRLPPSPSERFDAWVAFTDKDLGSKEATEAAFRELERTFDRRALDRRRRKRTLPGLFDERDLPLVPSHLRGVEATGAEVRVRSRWLNGVSVLATADQLTAIDKLPFVSEVSDVRRHVPKGSRSSEIPGDRHRPEPLPTGADALYGRAGAQVRQLGLDRLHAAGYRGAGVVVAVIDTGFLLSHAAFNRPGAALRIAAQRDFVDNDALTSPEPGDSPTQHEHGTLVLGAIAGNAPGELVGTAPDATYILCKAEDEATEYFLEERWFVAALEYAEAHGADLVTSSVVLYEGYDREDVDGRTSVMALGWNLAVGNGIVGLQGGGNFGHDADPHTHHLLPPAAALDVITVGAVDGSGRTAPFSSDGLMVEGRVKPELLALGVGTGTVSPFDEGAYTSSTGTSMATPVLAGAVASLLQIHPDWTVAEVREALFRSGDYFLREGMADPLFVRGYGIPDMAEAAGIALDSQ